MELESPSDRLQEVETLLIEEKMVMMIMLRMIMGMIRMIMKLNDGVREPN